MASKARRRRDRLARRRHREQRPVSINVTVDIDVPPLRLASSFADIETAIANIIGVGESHAQMFNWAESIARLNAFLNEQILDALYGAQALPPPPPEFAPRFVPGQTALLIGWPDSQAAAPFDGRRLLWHEVQILRLDPDGLYIVRDLQTGIEFYISDAMLAPSDTKIFVLSRVDLSADGYRNLSFFEIIRPSSMFPGLEEVAGMVMRTPERRNYRMRGPWPLDDIGPFTHEQIEHRIRQFEIGDANLERQQQRARDERQRLGGLFGFFDLSRNRREARERSFELLKSWLSSEQRADFEAGGSFQVRGSVTGRTYVITDGAMPFNIVELGADGSRRAKHCVVPRGAAAPGDVMLAQKIWLETDEEGTMAIANHDTLRYDVGGISQNDQGPYPGVV